MHNYINTREKTGSWVRQEWETCSLQSTHSLTFNEILLLMAVEVYILKESYRRQLFFSRIDDRRRTIDFLNFFPEFQ